MSPVFRPSNRLNHRFRREQAQTALRVSPFWRSWVSQLFGFLATLWVALSLSVVFLSAWGQLAPMPAVPAHSPAQSPHTQSIQRQGQSLSPVVLPAWQLNLKQPKQGQVVRLALKAPTDAGVKNWLVKLLSPAGHSLSPPPEPVPFFEIRPGVWEAMVPIDPLQAPGAAGLTVTDKTTGRVVYTTTLLVQSAQFPKQWIRVSKQTAGLQPQAGELEAIKAFKSTVSPTRFWAEPLQKPVPDCMNSPFAVRRIYNGVDSGDYHKGVDQKAPAGRPVKAIAGGVVKIARFYQLHGGTVGVDHGQGLTSIYIHQSKILVKPGQVVTAGQTLGRVGSTGFAAGPHLHWGLYAYGVPINPTQWLVLPACKA